MKKNFELWVYSHPTLKKLIMELKIAFLIIVTGISGALAAPSYSQVTKVSLDLENTTLEKVMDEIERQSEFYFIFNQKQIDVNRVVDVQAENRLITDILPELFDGTNVNFAVLDRKILLTTDPLEEKFSTGLSKNELQQNRITGTVTDENGNPLPGVNVRVEGTSYGAITDVSGKFSITRTSDNAVIVFSFIGYNTISMPVAGRSVVDVQMKPDVRTLEDVVVVGYGVQKKINLTGSVAQVTADRLENRPVANINQALQGVAPGLNIVPNTVYGGEPGASMAFNIRGIGSLSGGAPYVLVDGVPMDINRINPEDVESISILKDAASTAIYGSRAAYGVILVTTKSGKLDEKIETNYSNSFSWSAPTVLPGFVNSLDFANSMNEAAVNSGQNKLFTDETLQRIQNYQADPLNFPSMIPDPKDPNGWGYWNLANGNTDWYDVYFKDWAFSQKHNLGVSGGSRSTSYYLGLGWLDEGGKLNFANEKYQRYNLTANINVKVTDWLGISLKSKVNRSYNKYPISSESVTDRTQIFGMFARNWPNYPVFTPNGDLAMDLNQVPALKNGGSDKQYITDLWLSPSFELSLSKHWKVNGDVSYNSNNYRRTHFRAIINGFAVDGFTPVRHYSQNYNRLNQELTFNEYFTSNLYTKYERSLGEHFFSLLIGGQAELSNNLLLNGWRRDLVSQSVPSISTATGDKDVDDVISHWSTLGTFLRFSYNFNEKYLLEINGRYDGSSRFQEGRRWGFFPSASVGYNIWKENFWSVIQPVINTMKFRASYGSLGNQNVANYLHVEILPINTNLAWIMDGKRPIYTSTPSNTSIGLTWEESNTLNLGVDAGLLNDRLAFSFDWFNRKTINMFGPGEALPSVLGTGVPQENNATLQTKGIELMVNWKEAINNFTYGIGLVFSDNKSIVTQYNNPTKYINNYYEGKEYGEIWGYVSEGLFATDQEAAEWHDQKELYSKWIAGDVKYTDLNNDNKITRGTQTVDDPGDLKIIGNTSPRYSFGINANASYKGFDFDMFWQGIGKRDIWINNTAFWGVNTAFWNSSFQAHNMDYWSPDNTGSYFPRPYLTTENNKNHQVQTRYLQNGAYVRLKNIQLGYTLPGHIVQKMLLQKFRVYVSGENILTFSKMMDSFDPEANVTSAGGYLVYPLSKAFYVGINVTF
jgi:TonB-linked SusC/RagA family outer membrane protein